MSGRRHSDEGGHPSRGGGSERASPDEGAPIAQTAEWLDRPENDPVIQIEKVAWDEAGHVVHTSRVLSVPSRMTLRTIAES